MLEIKIDKSNFKDSSFPIVQITAEDVRSNESGGEDNTPFDKYDYMGVSIQNSIPLLKDGVKIHKRAIKGSMSFYHLKVTSRNDVLVTLNVEGMGDSDLFVNPGKFNFPSSSTYFKRSNGLSDDELTLTEADHDKNFPDKSKEVWYTIGVYTFNTCDFDLLTLQNKYKIVKSYSGQIYTLPTTHLDPVIFEFHAGSYSLEQFDIMYWSDSSNVEVFVTKYSKDDDLNVAKDEIDNPMLRNIPSFQNKLYAFNSSVVGKVTRSQIPVDNSCKRCYYLVGIYPVGSQKAKVSFFRYEDESVMKLSNHSTVKEILEAGENQSFKVHLDDLSNNLEIDFDLFEGSLDLTYYKP